MTDTWNPRLDVAEALEADGWTGDADDPLGKLRKNGALWCQTTDYGDSGIDGPGGWVLSFDPDVPTVVVVAACLAAAAVPAP
jgi:hypothetical protein